MIGGKRNVVLGMPILGGDDPLERPTQSIDNRNYLVTVGNREVPPRTEIDLNIDNQQDRIIRTLHDHLSLQ